MNTCLVGTAEYLGSSIEYHLITDVLDGTERYGILVQLGTEQAAISDISTSKERVQALAEQMMAGSVSPITARDIVEDWLAQ